MQQLTIPKGLSDKALKEVTTLTNRFNQIEEEKRMIDIKLEMSREI